MSTEISVDFLNTVARQASQKIVKKHLGKTSIKLYGVPRGGITCAYTIASIADVFRVVGKPEEADVIIDDIIDSGKTRDYFVNLYPDTDFYALFDKPKEWLVFPWEQTILLSADDIPTRLLQFIGEDARRGGLKETPERYLKSWKYFTSGYKQTAESVMKVFDDGAEHYDQMVLIKSIPVYSQCEHHLVPFFGVAHIAYIPDGKIVGLSKLSRVVDIFARRLQVQERLTSQIANALDTNLKPKGVAVVLECRHLCMEARGICQQGHTTVTSAMYGVFRHNADTRAEFMELIR